MKNILTILVLTFVLLAMCVGCSGREKGESQSIEISSESTILLPTDDETVFLTATPYCDLAYPKQWKDAVSISEEKAGEAYIVQFSLKADETPLFDLLFGSKDGNLLGTLIREEGNVVLRIRSYAFDSAREDYDTCCMMQEDVNVILQYLISDDTFAVNEIIEDEDTMFDIKTSLVSMKYPAKWQDIVTIEVTDTAVKFSYGENRLFDLLFSGEDGYLLGTYLGTPIRIVSYSVDQNSLSEEEYRNFCLMQEDVNVILQYLIEDPNFVISQ